MTYYGATDFARSFRTVRTNTIVIAEEIPEEKYGFRPAEGCRSVAETLVHIAVMSRVQEQIHAVEHRSTLVGFDFFGVMSKLQAEVKTPRTKAQVVELLREFSARLRMSARTDGYGRRRCRARENRSNSSAPVTGLSCQGSSSISSSGSSMSGCGSGGARNFLRSK